jgi:hypothetical protein
MPTGKRETGRRCDVFHSTDPQYSDDELDFLKAVEVWKKKSRKAFPTCCDYLAIAKELGYRKVEEPQ